MSRASRAGTDRVVRARARTGVAASLRRAVVGAVAGAVLLPVALVATAGPAAASADLAREGRASASSEQADHDGTFPAQDAVDGDARTRWASAKGPDEDVPFDAWWQVDLGATATVERVTLDWEAAHASRYRVLVAAARPDDAASWTVVATEAAGDGATDHVTPAQVRTARYVRVEMLERAPVRWDPARPHWYGYSLAAVEVWGVPGAVPASPVDTFEDGVPAAYRAWGRTPAETPTLRTAPRDREGAGAGNDVLEVTVPAPAGDGSWSGVSRALTPGGAWAEADGVSVWFLGRGAGGVLRLGLTSDDQEFEHAVVDDTAGWRRVTASFADLRPKGDPGSAARFDPAGASSLALTLTDLGPGAWSFDDLALVQRARGLMDAEGGTGVVATPGAGVFRWASSDAAVTLDVVARDRDGAPTGNRVLAGTYRIPVGGYGGFSHNLPSAQDWSLFRGIRLHWYASQDTRPASPTAGADVEVELRDGGSDGERSELWVATFKDTWSPEGSRWRVVELPFSAFRPSDHQTDPAAADGVLDLRRAWGYAVTLPAGGTAAVPFAVDDVELYGTARPAARLQVVPADDVTLVDPGATARVGVRVVTLDGSALSEPVTVRYRTVDGRAEAGTHYEPTSGTLTFPAGATSGSRQDVTVPTRATTGPSDARDLTLALSAGAGADVVAPPRVVLNAHGAPYLDPARPAEERVEDLLGRMTLAEKVGQMTQAERLGLASPTEVATLGLGSLLSGGGSVPEGNSPEAWADMVDGFQRQALSTRLQIPLLYGVDAVHGHSNLLGATIVPHNIGLGASRDPDLVRRVARVAAAETRATGVPWTFAPCLCVTRDERWGRSYESFGEDPALVTALARAAVVGLQGEDPDDLSGPDRVLATAKHWVGDGGTSYDASKAGSGYPIDQGVTRVASLDQLRRDHVAPYVPAVEAGVGSIMPSYSAVAVGDGAPLRMHEHRQLNTDVLKGELGFDGFLVSDWEAIGLLPGADYADKVERALDSGLDMAMEPYRYAEFVEAVTDAVQDGRVAEARVDDAVRRILRQKVALGLFEQPMTDRSGIAGIGSAEHRAVAREAVAASQVLLEDDGVLPLDPGARLYVAGSNADDLGHQMGGWSISWQGGSGDTTTGTTILEGIREVAPGARVTHSPDASAPLDGADVGVVVVGEPPYAEGIGDVGNNGRSLELPAADRAAVDRVCGALPCVVLVVSGRPQLVTEQLDDADALVASWLPGTEGAGVADVLFGRRPFTGRLPVSWPASAGQVPVNVGDADYGPLFPYGWGLRTDGERARLTAARDALPAGGARDAVDAVLAADVWSGDRVAGEPAAQERAVALLVTAAERTQHEAGGSAAPADAVVSVLRDLAQRGAVSPGRVADEVAGAERALAGGDAATAARLLAGTLG